MQYISPLLSPLHALQEDIPQAYSAAVSLHRSGGEHGGDQLLMIALNIAAIQNSAAKNILFLIPPFTSIEVLHRSICIALLQNTASRAFFTTRTTCIVSRSLLGRF